VNSAIQIADAMRALLQTPSLANYQKVFDLLCASEHYRPGSADIDDMAALLDQKKYEWVIERYNKANPNYVLDPRAAILVSDAHRKLGNTRMADVYASNSKTVCEAIRTTGDGTDQRPFVVTHASAAHGFCDLIYGSSDIVVRKTTRDGKHLLSLSCADGPEIWFDASVSRCQPRKTMMAAPALIESSGGAQSIAKHPISPPSETPPVRNAENHAAIVAHVQAHIGKVAHVFQEVVSPVLFVDVLVVEPTPERNWHTLVTSGMSSRAMSVPAGAEDFRYAEVMLCLPADWKLDPESLNHEEHFWPLRWLRLLARNVHQYKTWFGYGHTIPNGDPAAPFAYNTKLCGTLLLPPQSVTQRFNILDTGSKQIHFLAIVPVYKEELELRLNENVKTMIQRLSEAGIDELLNLKRKNTAQ
jgi:hypothetical protein